MFSPFRHGRLCEHDQILAIDGQPLDISQQEAIQVLKNAQGLVELVVARGPIPSKPAQPGDPDTGDSTAENPTDMVSRKFP